MENIRIIEAGQARTTNPTALLNGQPIKAIYDDVGRQLTTPYQMRDLVFTATASTATLAEVELFAGAAGSFHDLVEITFANTSGAAINIGLRDTTGGTVMKNFMIPASNTISKDFSVPVPQSIVATAWTIQNVGTGDISNTVVTVSATFIRNV